MQKAFAILLGIFLTDSAVFAWPWSYSTSHNQHTVTFAPVINGKTLESTAEGHPVDVMLQSSVNTHKPILPPAQAAIQNLWGKGEHISKCALAFWDGSSTHALPSTLTPEQLDAYLKQDDRQGALLVQCKSFPTMWPGKSETPDQLLKLDRFPPVLYKNQ